MQIEPDTLDTLVPHLMWQPVVENAIHHGISRSEGDGIIVIGSYRNGDKLRLIVRDNGPGLSQEKILHEGIGLSTLRSILNHLYGPAHSFKVENSPDGGLLASLEIPAVAANNHRDSAGFAEG
jgi:sensor histidine kinase YesM